MASRRVLVVMARWPAPGRCKRRLAELGTPVAARIQAHLCRHTLAAARLGAERAGAELLLAAAGVGPRARRRWSAQLGPIASTDQGQGGLGCRLQRLLRRGFRPGAAALVLIGSDLPGLEARDLEAAFAALEGRDLVLGPASDGGYWLLGLSRQGFRAAGARLTSGIPWGTAAVLQATLAGAAAAGLSPALLRVQGDLDRPADLQPWQQPQRWPWLP